MNLDDYLAAGLTAGERRDALEAEHRELAERELWPRLLDSGHLVDEHRLVWLGAAITNGTLRVTHEPAQRVALHLREIAAAPDVNITIREEAAAVLATMAGAWMDWFAHDLRPRVEELEAVTQTFAARLVSAQDHRAKAVLRRLNNIIHNPATPPDVEAAASAALAAVISAMEKP